ncbi:hypothetical protein NXT3_CH01382 [Sinorhizobium fredii]|uniref:Uncharacterized protein n=1 Tax=Rhizobium fredii TaxID=380 RepID=A0A2L0H5B0_RHIFR|nr:hypothetical protein NXT3_CH01382 [Sinorhizobium fredii]
MKPSEGSDGRDVICVAGVTAICFSARCARYKRPPALFYSQSRPLGEGHPNLLGNDVEA